MPVLQTIDLKKYYQQGENVTKALDGVSLEIEAGEFVAVVGTSGSGKSTLLHMMGGLDNPTSGKVIVNGEDISKRTRNSLPYSVGVISDLCSRAITLSLS